MIRLVAARLVQAIVVLLAVSVLLFGLRQILGNPILTLLPPGATKAEIRATERAYGLDKPLYVQYGIWLAKATSGDMGNSLSTGQPALPLVLQKLPASAALSGVALLLSAIVSLPLGVVAAVKRNSALDRGVKLIAALGQSVPVFFLGIFSIAIFAVHWRIFPVAGFTSPLSLVLPALALSAFSVAGMTRLLRASMIDALGSQYVQMARAKGIPESAVVWKHALRNAILPVITFASLFFAINIGYVVVIEDIFAWPGVGSLALTSTLARDYPVLQATILVLTLIVVVANLFADVVHGALDPRVRAARP